MIVNCKTMYIFRRDSLSTSTTSEILVKCTIIRSGLIPGGRSLKKGRQSVFFTTVNPMDDDHGMEETPCDLNNPTITPYRKLGNLIKMLFFGAI